VLLCSFLLLFLRSDSCTILFAQLYTTQTHWVRPMHVVPTCGSDPMCLNYVKVVQKNCERTIYFIFILFSMLL
jgi:hypothetical protein